MRKVNCKVDSREEPYAIMVRTIIKGKIKLGPIDVEVRIGPVVGEGEYVVLTRMPGQKAWLESWRLAELAGFVEEFTHPGQPMPFRRFIAAISGLVDRAARIEAMPTKKAA